jgi:tetratricopeptide (TPR) repeat protein
MLDNSLSILDLAGLFTLACSGKDLSDTLEIAQFAEFLNGAGKVKYPVGGDFVERLLTELRDSKQMKISAADGYLGKIFEKNLIKMLLKYDFSLKRVFSTFAGKNIRLGAGLSWQEVKAKAIGMEIDGFISFAGSYGIAPNMCNTQQLTQFIRQHLDIYPLKATQSSLNSTIMYPQFQLLLCIFALNQYEAKQKAGGGGLLLNKGAAAVEGGAKERLEASRKLVQDTRLPHEIVQEFFRDIGIDRDNLSPTKRGGGVPKLPPIDHPNKLELKLQGLKLSDKENKAGEAFGMQLTLPSTSRPEDPYLSNLEHTRQAMLMRVNFLVDEIEVMAKEYFTSLSNANELQKYLSLTQYIEDQFDPKSKYSSKPQVIGDAVGIPKCPTQINQFLQAALAHHNLGNVDEALKFLEAAKVMVDDISKKLLPNPDLTMEEVRRLEKEYKDVSPVELHFFIILSKGNIYQTCGDDEQAIGHYLEGRTKAKDKKNKDWEIIFLNALGIMAYYNVQYQVSAICFKAVSLHRLKTNGEQSADTATTWNNEGCAFFNLNRKNDARMCFERSWNTLCQVLGHRSARVISVWKNLEKARRCHGLKPSAADLGESVTRRPDAEQLLVGGVFTIKALPPPDNGKKKKKKKGGKKGGKGKKK